MHDPPEPARVWAGYAELAFPKGRLAVVMARGGAELIVREKSLYVDFAGESQSVMVILTKLCEPTPVFGVPVISPVVKFKTRPAGMPTVVGVHAAPVHHSAVHL